MDCMLHSARDLSLEPVMTDRMLSTGLPLYSTPDDVVSRSIGAVYYAMGMEGGCQCDNSARVWM